VTEILVGYTAKDGRRWQWPVTFERTDLKSGPSVRIRRGQGADGSSVVQKIAVGGIEAADRLCDEIDVGVTLQRRLGAIGYSDDMFPPEICRYIGVNEGDERPFILMLTPSMTARSLDKVPPPRNPAEKRLFATGLFTGLYWLEQTGVVHQDLTPGNILWENGRLQIIDFSHAVFEGAARQRTHNPPWDEFDYPTQRALPFDDLRRAGWLLLHVVTGEPPGTLQKRYEDDQIDLSVVPGDVATCIELVLGKPGRPSQAELAYRDARYRPSLAELLHELGETIPARPTRADTPRIDRGRAHFRLIKETKERRRGRLLPAALDWLPATGRRLPRWPSLPENVQRSLPFVAAGVFVLFVLLLMVGF
jgi:hypothetical protein